MSPLKRGELRGEVPERLGLPGNLHPGKRIACGPPPRGSPRPGSPRATACRRAAASRGAPDPCRPASRTPSGSRRTSRCRSRRRGCRPSSYSATASAWPGYWSGGMCGSEPARVDEHRVAADRLHDRHAERSAASRRCTRWCARDSAGSARRRFRAGRLRDRLEVAAREAAVGREALRSGSGGCGPSAASASSLIASQPPMFANASFLALMVMPSATANMSRTMSAHRARCLPRLAALDEPRVLRETAAVDEERLAVAVRRPRASRGCSRGSPAARRRRCWSPSSSRAESRRRATRSEQRSSRARSMLPLNGCRASRVACPRRSPGRRPCAPVASMLPRVVSKWRVRGMSGPGRRRAEKRMRLAARPWCVGMTCRKRHQLAHRRLEAVVATASPRTTRRRA